MAMGDGFDRRDFSPKISTRRQAGRPGPLSRMRTVSFAPALLSSIVIAVRAPGLRSAKCYMMDTLFFRLLHSSMGSAHWPMPVPYYNDSRTALEQTAAV
jgi:hypothetical protein